MKAIIQLILASALLAHPLQAQDTRLDSYLGAGKLQDGITAFANPPNDGDRFSLGILQALQGLQQFSDGAGRLGIRETLVNSGLPFFRVLPHQAGDNPPPHEQATPGKIRLLFQNLREALTTANATLAKAGEGDFKVRVDLSKARLENQDGTPGTPLSESLGRIMNMQAQDTQDLVIHFDSADAVWLRGYTHILLGMLDVFMCYDWQPVWNQSAHVFFTSPDPLPPIAKHVTSSREMQVGEWADIVAAIHDMRLEVIDADGMKKAVAEFQAALACSRICWKRVLAETDDDHEWLPSPTQKGPRDSKITQPQIDAWMTVLDEVDAILAGKKLLPHWRMTEGMGINVAKMVQTPPKFDLVLMIQGSAFLPYVERGDVSDQTRWRTLIAPFGPGFASFALWSN